MTSRRPSAETGTKMSHDAERWARAQKAGKASAKAVLIELAWRRNPDDGKCFPSVETLAESLEMDRKTVMGATAHLEKIGLIAKRVVWEGRKKFIFYEFPSFNPAEWAMPAESTKKGCTKNGTTKKGSTKNGTYEGTKSGTYGGTENGTETRKVNSKEEQERFIASAASASASEPTLFPEVDQPKPKKTSRRKPQVPCPWKPGTPLPDHLKEWAAENFPTLNAEQVFQEFIGWMIAKDVRNAVWDQAFRNWMANELKKQAKRGGYYRESRKPVDRSHFAHEKPFSQKDFSMTEQEKRDMAYIFALDAQEKAEKERAATGAKE